MSYLYRIKYERLAYFSTAYSQSGLTKIDDSLRITVAPFASTESIKRLQTNLFVAIKAAEHAITLVSEEQSQAHSAITKLEAFENRLNLLKKNVISRLRISEDGQMQLSEQDRGEGRVQLQRVLIRTLTWWKLPLGRADDVFVNLAQTASSFFRALETQVRDLQPCLL